MNRSTILLAVLAGALAAYLAARRAVPAVAEFEASAVAKVSTAIGDLLAGFEGFRSEPYLDNNRKWTIGFGHLIVRGDGFWHPDWNPDGVRYISVEDARALKERDMAIAINAVDRCVHVSLNDNQHAALVSLAFNIGESAFCGSSVVKNLNAGNYEAAADWILAWNKVTDPATGELVVSPGLVKRREQERELFLA